MARGVHTWAVLEGRAWHHPLRRAGPRRMSPEPASRAHLLSPDESLHAWKDRPAALRPQLQGSERLPITLNTVLYGLPHQAIV